MSKSIVVAPATTADRTAGPVTPSWVLSGKPETRSKELARSHDRTSNVMAWDCTAGSFTWHYNKDEVLVVLEGEAFITNEKGEERRIGTCDEVFLPAGPSSIWIIQNYTRQVA